MRKAPLKRQTKKQSQLRKTTKKSNTFEFGVFDLAIPPNITEPKNLNNISTKWVPFGNDNLFPQYLAELKRKSSTHRSVLAQKTVFTSGAKFVCDNEPLREFIEDVNANQESLRDVFKIEDLHSDKESLNIEYYKKMDEVEEEQEGGVQCVQQ